MNDNTKLYLKFDGADGGTGIVDSSPIGHTVTNNNVVLESDRRIEGATSGKFNGSNAYLTVPSHTGFDAGTTGDITVHSWVQPVAWNGGLGVLADKNTSGRLIYFEGNGGTVNLFGSNIALTRTLALGPWQHVAGVRASGLVALFIGGKRACAWTPNSANLTADNALYIGAAYNASVPWNCYMDMFQIDRQATWTDDFEPPGIQTAVRHFAAGRFN